MTTSNNIEKFISEWTVKTHTSSKPSIEDITSQIGDVLYNVGPIPSSVIPLSGSSITAGPNMICPYPNAIPISSTVINGMYDYSYLTGCFLSRTETASELVYTLHGYQLIEDYEIIRDILSLESKELLNDSNGILRFKINDKDEDFHFYLTYKSYSRNE